MKKLTWLWVITLAIAAAGPVLAGPEEPAGGASGAEAAAEIPVEPALQEQIRATFAGRVEAALAATEAAQARAIDALLEEVGEGTTRADISARLDAASAELDRQSARLANAKRAAIEELEGRGIAFAVVEQEWKKWFADREEAKKKESAGGR